MLQAIQTSGAISAVIAGGAVRDALLGKPIRDIDVYVPKNEALLIEPWGLDTVIYDSDPTYSEVDEIDSIYRLDGFANLPLSTDLIVMDFPGEPDGAAFATRVLSSFTADICAAGYAGYWGLIAGADFHSAARDKRLGLRPGWDVKGEYVSKLRQKFPDFKD